MAIEKKTQRKQFEGFLSRFRKGKNILQWSVWGPQGFDDQVAG